jgi:hypothetical protein
MTLLQIVAGPAAGTSLEVDEPLVIGRDEERAGSLGGDPELSRRHARISALKDGRLVVEDLGSTNGTLVNGAPVTGPTVVTRGDAVAVGGTTLRVVGAVESEPSRAEPGAPLPEPVVDLAVGGVHAVPTNLLSLLVARAPVRRDWIIRTVLSILPVVIAINLIIRTVAVEYLGVSHHLPMMRLEVLLPLSIIPVIGNSFGFYHNFGRPANRSPLPYLASGMGVTAFFCTLELLILPSHADVLDHVVTVTIVLVAPSVVYPIMLGLRVRAALAAQARFGRSAG